MRERRFVESVVARKWRPSSRVDFCFGTGEKAVFLRRRRAPINLDGMPAPPLSSPYSKRTQRAFRSASLRTRRLRIGVFGLFFLGMIAFILVQRPRPRLNPDAPTLPPAGALRGLASPGSRSAVDPKAVQEAREFEACQSRIAEVLEGSSLPGAPELERSRATLLMRAKAEPVLFLRAPSFTTAVTSGISAHQKRLSGRYARDATLELLRAFAHRKEVLRQLFLREGYYYTEDPAAARESSVRLSFEQLFDAPELVVERGSELLRAVRGKKGKYSFVGLGRPDEPAQLLLFDRVWPSNESARPALHLDVRELVEREAIDQIEPLHLAASALVANVRFEDEWVRGVFTLQPPDLTLNCLEIEPGRVAAVGRAKDRAYRHAAVVRQLRHAVIRQVQAGLPFDEPRTERGQQDGELRERWERAYFGGRANYEFNGDKYEVFDRLGQPMTPQVCVDFVTETLERASGMHFAARDVGPEKIVGSLNFDVLLEGQRRRELALRQFASANPHRLELVDFPQSEWVRYEDIAQFFGFLEKKKEIFSAGDIVVIRGRAAWDHYREIHTHTFLIYETDPITGVPILIAGNSGKPRILTWDAEMIRAPKRSIRHRIRPNMEWLYDHVVLGEPTDGERWAAPLSVFERG